MKRYPKDFLIQFTTRKTFIGAYRTVFYRIAPNQLAWVDRVFCNKWRQLWRASTYDGSEEEIFEAREFKDYFSDLKTVGDVEAFINKQILIGKEIRQKELNERKERYLAGEIWEDEIENF